MYFWRFLYSLWNYFIISYAKNASVLLSSASDKLFKEKYGNIKSWTIRIISIYRLHLFLSIVLTVALYRRPLLSTKLFLKSTRYCRIIAKFNVYDSQESAYLSVGLLENIINCDTRHKYTVFMTNKKKKEEQILNRN